MELEKIKAALRNVLVSQKFACREIYIDEQAKDVQPLIEVEVTEAVKAERENTRSKISCIESNLDYSHEGNFHFRKMILSLELELKQEAE